MKPGAETHRASYSLGATGLGGQGDGTDAQLLQGGLPFRVVGMRKDDFLVGLDREPCVLRKFTFELARTPAGVAEGHDVAQRAATQGEILEDLRAVAKVINQLPNRVTISGHTSANAYGKKQDGDWALSAQRADASRQILRGAGVDDDRIYQVSGKANSEPLYADDPTLAGNRRISIVLLREKPVLPDGL